jgi:hypothetical protein
MDHGLKAGIHSAGSGERFSGAGGDTIVVRYGSVGDDPITVIEGTSFDTEPAPLS